MSVRDMIFSWAEHFMVLPSDVENIPFWQFCEEYNDFRLRDEWQEYYKAHTTTIKDGRASVPVME